HKDRGDTDAVGLTLDGVEDLGDLESRRSFNSLEKRHVSSAGAAGQCALPGMCARRSVASFAASLLGNFCVTSISVLRASVYFFCSYCVYPSFNIASGALRESGHLSSTARNAPLALS